MLRRGIRFTMSRYGLWYRFMVDFVYSGGSALGMI